jgi:hypothetical protein
MRTLVSAAPSRRQSGHADQAWNGDISVRVSTPTDRMSLICRFDNSCQEKFALVAAGAGKPEMRRPPGTIKPLSAVEGNKRSALRVASGARCSGKAPTMPPGRAQCACAYCALRVRRHPEALALFGEPRRMAAYAPVAILRDAAPARGSSRDNAVAVARG